MDIHIRNAEKTDYKAVSRIMNQVQEMHVTWRPDIYRSNENLISEDIFDLMVSGGNLFVADVGGIVAGVLEVVYKHIESPAHMDLLRSQSTWNYYKVTVKCTTTNGSYRRGKTHE